MTCDLDRVPDDEQQALGRELDLIIAGERQAIEHRLVGCAETAFDDQGADLDGGEQPGAGGRVVQISHAYHQALVSFTSTPGR